MNIALNMVSAATIASRRSPRFGEETKPALITPAQQAFDARYAKKGGLALVGEEALSMFLGQFTLHYKTFKSLFYDYRAMFTFGNPAKKEALLRQSLAVMESRRFISVKLMHDTLNHLAEVCREQGKTEEADMFAQRAKHYDALFKPIFGGLAKKP